VKLNVRQHRQEDACVAAEEREDGHDGMQHKEGLMQEL
jgi:hypothetical protein